MKTIKSIDFFLQIIAVALGLVLCLFYQTIFGFAITYIFLGFYQPISFLVHFPSGNWDSKARKFYGLGLLLFAGLAFVYSACSVSFNATNDAVAVIMLVLATTLAILYIHLSYAETFGKNKKI
jgi:hypothetical protein